MKRLFSLLAVVFVLGLSTLSMSAEAAKRMGSGKSVGMQRQAAPDKSPAVAAGAAAAPATRSWMGPVAGLAAGLGLAALASHLGFGDELASMIMMGLLAAAVMVAIGFFMRKRAAAHSSGMKNPAGLQYAHVQAGTTASSSVSPTLQGPAYKVSMPSGGSGAEGAGAGSAIGSGIGAGILSASRIPAGFDREAFERNAKVNFIRLQAANDAGNLDDIREFTTPEMFAELKMELAERGSAVQKSDVVRIDAQVQEVEEDSVRYLVSVRFTGVIRDAVNNSEEAFDEIWHLSKPRSAAGGWVLAGIQQVA